jgi:hypothetical protein
MAILRSLCEQECASPPLEPPAAPRPSSATTCRPHRARIVDRNQLVAAPLNGVPITTVITTETDGCARRTTPSSSTNLSMDSPTSMPTKKAQKKLTRAAPASTPNRLATRTRWGHQSNIKSNVIAPIAKSRMTETIMPPNVLEKLLPEYVSPLVAYLCSEGLEESAQVYAVGGGYVSRGRWWRGKGCSSSRTRGSRRKLWRGSGRRSTISAKAKPYGNAMEAAGAAMKGAF